MSDSTWSGFTSFYLRFSILKDDESPLSKVYIKCPVLSLDLPYWLSEGHPQVYIIFLCKRVFLTITNYVYFPLQVKLFHTMHFAFFFAFCFPPGLPVIRKANISICNIIVYYSWDNFQVHLSFVVLQYIHSWTLRAYHKSVSLSSLFIVFSFDSSQYFASVLIST